MDIRWDNQTKVCPVRFATLVVRYDVIREINDILVHIIKVEMRF
jgi:hypothetical protein